MRVLHQVNNLSVGGVETFVYRLCKYSREAWVGVYAHGDGVVREWLEEEGIEVYFREIEEVIKERKVDVLVMHTGSYIPPYVPALKEKFPNLKFITVLHTPYTADTTYVDKVICVAHNIFTLNDPNKSVLIYPGIDRKEKFIVGEISRLAPYKYTEDLLNIIEYLVPYYPEIYLKIIGEEASDAIGYLKKLKDIVTEKSLDNHVEFCGYLRDINFEEFDAFVHLVGNESYPVTLLEALDHGIKTVSYPGVGTVEIQRQYPHLVLVDSWESAAKFLAVVMGGRPKHIKRVAEEFNDVYKEVLA